MLKVSANKRYGPLSGVLDLDGLWELGHLDLLTFSQQPVCGKDIRGKERFMANIAYSNVLGSGKRIEPG